MFWGLCRVPWRTQSLAWRGLTPPSLLIPNRGKKSAKKKRPKKDQRLQEMKDFVQRREMQKLLLSATLKAAKYGEPLDPEMLNPARKRVPPNLLEDEKERRILLSKQWSRDCMKRHMQELQFLQGVVRSRRKALSELKKVSQHLYSKALELQPDLFPLNCMGPTTNPPLQGYVPPDPTE